MDISQNNHVDLLYLTNPQFIDKYNKTNPEKSGISQEDIKFYRKRILETTKLWQFFIALGGNLEPEPDPQSPFYFKKTSR